MAPYEPTSVREAWENHFKHFAAFDEEKILGDYDADSVVAVYNDFCSNESFQLVSEYKGLTAIKGMFTVLFDTLGRDLANVGLANFTSGGGVNPHCEPNLASETTVDANSNVLLVWSAAGQGITYATDTFTWKTGYKVVKQNIVVTEPSAACGATVAPPEGAAGAITAAWDNHFGAFGSKNVTQIMMDYTAASIIRVWDNSLNVYSSHAGLGAIETMFTDLFAAITAGATTPGDPATEGITVPLISVTPQYKSVFLVWTSNSHPKATDTFLFDDAGKITRQNIVTNTKVENVVQVVV